MARTPKNRYARSWTSPFFEAALALEDSGGSVSGLQSRIEGLPRATNETWDKGQLSRLFNGFEIVSDRKAAELADRILDEIGGAARLGSDFDQRKYSAWSKRFRNWFITTATHAWAPPYDRALAPFFLDDASSVRQSEWKRRYQESRLASAAGFNSYLELSRVLTGEISVTKSQATRIVRWLGEQLGDDVDGGLIGNGGGEDPRSSVKKDVTARVAFAETLAWILQALGAKGLTVEALAKEGGVSSSTLRRWARPDSNISDAARVRSVAHILVRAVRRLRPDADIEEEFLDRLDMLFPPASVPARLRRSRSATAATTNARFGAEAISTAPPQEASYVERPNLQNKLMNELTDIRRRTITLKGRGGVGKTSLALWANEWLMDHRVYVHIWWLSARDVDLTNEGPVDVAPDIRSFEQAARRVAAILNQDVLGREIEFLSEKLQTGRDGRTLWVWDNFESLPDPGSAFEFIDQLTTQPNTSLITTRHRTFEGDRPIEVSGMELPEFELLVHHEEQRLRIPLLTASEIDRLFNETEGHPYITKFLLGSRKRGEALNDSHRISSQDRWLEALFRKSFEGLSDAGRLSYLALCASNDLVLRDALELGLIQAGVDRTASARAIDEITEWSLATERSSSDGIRFLDVPASARTFGRRRLKTDTHKVTIEAVGGFLSFFGTVSAADLDHHHQRPDRTDSSPAEIQAIAPLAEKLRSAIAAGSPEESTLVAVVRDLGSRFPWVLLTAASHLYESGKLDDAERLAKDYCGYTEDEVGWQMLARIRADNQDVEGEIDALVKRAELPNASFLHIVDAARRLNAIAMLPETSLGEWFPILDRAVIQLMESKMDEASADGCGELGDIYLRHQRPRDAIRVLQEGLEIRPRHLGCMTLLVKAARMDAQMND